MSKPEEKARQRIDQLLQDASWDVQDVSAFNPGAGQGQAVREYPTSAGPADDG